VVKRKIPSPRWESNPRTPIVQSVAQRYTDWTDGKASIWSGNNTASSAYSPHSCYEFKTRDVSMALHKLHQSCSLSFDMCMQAESHNPPPTHNGHLSTERTSSFQSIKTDIPSDVTKLRVDTECSWSHFSKCVPRTLIDVRMQKWGQVMSKLYSLKGGGVLQCGERGRNWILVAVVLAPRPRPRGAHISISPTPLLHHPRKKGKQVKKE